MLKNLLKLIKYTSSINKTDILKLLSSDNKDIIIFEAGAANGFDTLELSNLFPEAKIFAFEPVNQNFNVLCSTIRNCQNVKAIKMALSDKNGETKIYVSKDINHKKELASSSSLKKPKEHIKFHPNIKFDSFEMVRTSTIDSWARDNNINSVDVMWLDMQGMEYNVLKASPNILKTLRVLYTEVSLIEMYEETLLYEEYKNWLINQGFVLIKEELPWKDMGNALFARI